MADDAEVCWERAKDAAASGRPTALTRDLREALRRDPSLKDRPAPWLDPWRENPYVVLALGADEALGRASALIGARQPEEALAALRSVMETTPHPGTAWFLASVAAAVLERHAEAIEAARKATELVPSFPDAWFNLAFSYDRACRHSEAFEAWRQSVTVDPGFANGWFSYGYGLLVLGRVDEAEAVLREGLGHHPDEPRLRYRYAECLARLGRTTEAAAELERAALLDPGVRAAIRRNAVFPKAFDAATLARLSPST